MGKITGLLQHDLFHIYPVDDHILTVLHNIRRFAMKHVVHENPFASSLMQSFPATTHPLPSSHFSWYSQGRGGNHSLRGVADARKFAADPFPFPKKKRFIGLVGGKSSLMPTVAQKTTYKT